MLLLQIFGSFNGYCHSNRLSSQPKFSWTCMETTGRDGFNPRWFNWNRQVSPINPIQLRFCYKHNLIRLIINNPILNLHFNCYRDYVPGLLCIRDAGPNEPFFQNLEMPFSTPSSCGADVPLSTKYKEITYENRLEYVRLALNFR